MNAVQGLEQLQRDGVGHPKLEIIKRSNAFFKEQGTAGPRLHDDRMELPIAIRPDDGSGRQKWKTFYPPTFQEIGMKAPIHDTSNIMEDEYNKILKRTWQIAENEKICRGYDPIEATCYTQCWARSQDHYAIVHQAGIELLTKIQELNAMIQHAKFPETIEQARTAAALIMIERNKALKLFKRVHERQRITSDKVNEFLMDAVPKDPEKLYNTMKAGIIYRIPLCPMMNRREMQVRGAAGFGMAKKASELQRPWAKVQKLIQKQSKIKWISTAEKQKNFTRGVSQPPTFRNQGYHQTSQIQQQAITNDPSIIT